MFCTPAINLFHKRADRIHLSESAYEYHVVPDRTRPLDFEVYEVTAVVGHGIGTESDQTFLPFYAVWRIGAAATALGMVGRKPWIRTARAIRPEQREQ